MNIKNIVNKALDWFGGATTASTNYGTSQTTQTSTTNFYPGSGQQVQEPSKQLWEHIIKTGSSNDEYLPATGIKGSVGNGGTNNHSDVEMIQQLLNNQIARGVLGPRKKLAVTGSVDQATVEAIKQFQKVALGSNSPDGRVDPNGKTFEALCGQARQSAPVARKEVPPTPSIPKNTVATLLGGSVGRGGQNTPDDVRVIQELLQRNHQYLGPMKPVEVTGMMDAQTLKAIEVFQRNALGMKQPDGLVQVEGKTLQRLVTTVSTTKGYLDHLSGVAAGTAFGFPKDPGAKIYTILGRNKVTPDVALEILKNSTKAAPPFRPDLGMSGVSWFTTKGEPYTGTNAAKSISITTELAGNTKPIVFREAELVKIFNEEYGIAEKKVWQDWHEIQNNKPQGSRATPTSGNTLQYIQKHAKKLAERRMWERVGQMVRNAPDGIGRVELRNSRFSKIDGDFMLTADPHKIRTKGGVGELLQSLKAQGVEAEPVVVEAAEKMVRQLDHAATVRGVFRIGGRILIVAGLVNDGIKIYQAQDKTKAVVESAGGWAGASAAGAAFAAWFTPADVAGPWAWAAHGVGTLAAGGIGYWVGSETTRTIYELAFEGDVTNQYIPQP